MFASIGCCDCSLFQDGDLALESREALGEREQKVWSLGPIFNQSWLSLHILQQSILDGFEMMQAERDSIEEELNRVRAQLLVVIEERNNALTQIRISNEERSSLQTQLEVVNEERNIALAHIRVSN